METRTILFLLCDTNLLAVKKWKRDKAKIKIKTDLLRFRNKRETNDKRERQNTKKRVYFQGAYHSDDVMSVTSVALI